MLLQGKSEDQQSQSDSSSGNHELHPLTTTLKRVTVLYITNHLLIAYTLFVNAKWGIKNCYPCSFPCGGSWTISVLLATKHLFIRHTASKLYSENCISYFKALTNSNGFWVYNDLFIMAEPLLARRLSCFEDIRHTAKCCNFCRAPFKGTI